MKVWGDPGAFAADLVSALPARPPTALARALATCESAAQQQLPILLDASAAGALAEGRVIYEVFQHIHEGSAVFLSASLVFREADYFVPCLPKRLSVGANRGATGIEYGLIAAGISIAIIGVVNTLGGNLSNIFSSVSSALGG